jgi:hypothetical protein
MERRLPIKSSPDANSDSENKPLIPLIYANLLKISEDSRDLVMVSLNLNTWETVNWRFGALKQPVLGLKPAKNSKSECLASY